MRHQFLSQCFDDGAMREAQVWFGVSGLGAVAAIKPLTLQRLVSDPVAPSQWKFR